MFYFDEYGWHTTVELEGRDTDIAPPEHNEERIVGQPYPNFTGKAWLMIEYFEPLPPVVQEDERVWWLDIGPFKDRLGMDIGAIAASNHSACKGVIEFLNGRKYIDLKDPKVGLLLDVMIANNQPTADPVWPTSGPITLAKKTVILTTPTTDSERHIKGLPDPVGA